MHVECIASGVGACPGEHTMTIEASEVEDTLRIIDAACIEQGLPPLSVIVTRSGENRPGPVFWETVARHDLRHTGESDRELVARVRSSAQKAARQGLYPKDSSF
jgi:hypothetical protein